LHPYRSSALLGRRSQASRPPVTVRGPLARDIIHKSCGLGSMPGDAGDLADPLTLRPGRCPWIGSHGRRKERAFASPRPRLPSRRRGRQTLTLLRIHCRRRMPGRRHPAARRPSRGAGNVRGCRTADGMDQNQANRRRHRNLPPLWGRCVAEANTCSICPYHRPIWPHARYGGPPCSIQRAIASPDTCISKSYLYSCDRRDM